MESSPHSSATPGPTGQMASTPTESAAGAKPGLHLKRPCLIVADLERSLTLYRDVLGFRLDYVGEASASSYLYTVFAISPQAEVTFAALSTEREVRALALTEVKGVAIPPPSPPYAIGTVIQVAELAPTITAVEALGLPAVPPMQFTAPPNLTFTEQGFRDFDGHLIILYQVTGH